MPTPNPSDWFSALCRDACKEVRKKIGVILPQEKQSDILGQVWCKRDPNTHVIHACPCVMDIRIESGEQFKWDECPEIAWCIYKHEVGHIESSNPPMCYNQDLCKGLMLGDVLDEYHKKQYPRDDECMRWALRKIAGWPESPKKDKCIRLVDDLVTKTF